MPRPLRIEYEDAWYHVMNRGTNHQNIFNANNHRTLFLSLLEEISIQFGVEIHAYCLMDNHYHLLMKTPFANLSIAMRYLDSVYTQKYNTLTKRDGSLFRGRYKSILVENDIYLLQVSRYIHLNPVSANICAAPEQFYWSSYPAYIHKEIKPAWLHVDALLMLNSEKNYCENFAKFVSEGIDEQTSNFYNKKYYSSIFGGKKFIHGQLSSLNKEYKKAVATDINRTKLIPSLDLISRIVAEYYKIDVNKLLSTKQGKQNKERLMAIHLSRELALCNYNKIANYFNQTKPQSIGPILSRYKKLLNKNEKLKSDLEFLKKQLKTC